MRGTNADRTKDAAVKVGPDARECENFLAIVRRLRRDCPWDRKQTHGSTRPLFIEECYEVVEALDEGDAQELKGELGDLLYLVFLNGVISEERGGFGTAAVFKEASDKLVRRHPHVFGDAQADDDIERIKSERERIKAQEKRRSLLGGIPKQLPSLLYAQKVREKTERAGMPVPGGEEAWLMADSLLESLRPGKRSEAGNEDPEEAFGELLLALSSLAHNSGVDLEEALAKSNKELARKVSSVEVLLQAEGKTVFDANVDELADRWRQLNSEDGASTP